MAYSAAEFGRSIFGAWEIFKGNSNGLQAFDMSFTGFWRSFVLILPLALPFAIVSNAEFALLHEEIFAHGVEIPSNVFYLSRALGLVINWITLPLVLALLARPLAFTHGYVAFIVVRNWCQLLAILPFSIAALAYLAGLVGAEAYVILSLVATGIALRLQYLVARTALGAGIVFALGIVVLDYLLSLLVAGPITRFLVGL